MRKIIKLSCLSVCVFLLQLSLPAFADVPSARMANGIVVFGDSLSDTGNIYHATDNASKLSGIAGIKIPAIPDPTIYRYHTFNNGYNWDQWIMRDALGWKGYGPGQTIYTIQVPLQKTASVVFRDYAFGGATIGGAWWKNDQQKDSVVKAGSGIKVIIPTIDSQISMYLTAHGGKANAQTLYAISGGGNNLWKDETGTLFFATCLSNALLKQVQRLIDAGAKYILVTNFPDVTKSPRWFMTSDQKTRDAMLLLIQRANRKLNAGIARLNNQYASANVHIIPVPDIVAQVIAAFKAKYPQSDINVPCHDIRFTSEGRQSAFSKIPSLNAAYLAGTNAQNPGVCDDGQTPPAEHLFFDEVHPNTNGQLFVARALCNALQTASTQSGYQFEFPTENGGFQPLDCSGLPQPF